MSEVRQTRDRKDTLAVLHYLQDRNPFCNDSSLRSIVTGGHAHPTVNVDAAHAVEATILNLMEGRTPDEHTFRRKDQVVTLGTQNSVRIDGDDVQGDPLLLFQRLITVAQTSDELESAFKHEQCSYTPSLFDSSLLLREEHKPALADAIWRLIRPDVPADVPDDGSRYVVDGGALIQRIPWTRGSTRGCIGHQYTKYVKHKCRDAIVMFDGYDSTNTKDVIHQRRSKGNAGTTVTFTADTLVTMTKEQFLANRQNKQRFIFMLSEELKKNNCEVHHASGDADLLIVMIAVQSANSSNTLLVGDDTDLLVLLCYASIESHDLLFCPEPKKNTPQPRIWNIKETKQRLGPDICQHILFLHAVLGCDTTSRLHGIGRELPSRNSKLATNFVNRLKYCIRIQLPCRRESIGGTIQWKLDWQPGLPSASAVLWEGRIEHVSCSSTSTTLQPTSGAAMYRSLSVYLQVQEWKGSAGGLRPTEWGHCLVLSYVLANTPMESNGQGWGAWSSLVELY